MTDTITDFSSRESLISVNSTLIAQLRARLKAKRFRPQEGDSMRIGYMRALVQALQCQNSILKDTEIDDLKKEIEELRQFMKCRE
jgi:hypothetical protein